MVRGETPTATKEISSIVPNATASACQVSSMERSAA
jgi:hypothetical protein